MSSPPLRRAIVAFPQIEIESPWAPILALRERHDPLARWVAPHLTLAYPFEDPAPNEVLEAEVRAALDGMGTFRVALQGVSAHEGEYLFLNVKRGNDEIIALHDAVYRGRLALHRSRAHTFVPHVTVGRVAPADLAAALEASAGCDALVAGTVDAVSMYEICPHGPRRVAWRVPLGPA